MGRISGVHDLHTVSPEGNTTGPIGDGGIFFILKRTSWCGMIYNEVKYL